MRVRSVLLSLAVAAGAISGMVATAAPAAALPTCLGASAYQGTDGQYLRPTTVDNSRDVNCVLREGSRSKAVGVLQRSLDRCYGHQVGFDGIFGPRTTRAVQQVQQFHGLTPDGVLGPATNLAMYWPYVGLEHCFRP